jgi:3-hydroxyisobutyrate dehydrogenase
VLPGVESGFTAGLMRKDVRLAMELAQAVGAAPEACGRAAAVWEDAPVADAEDFNRVAAALLGGERA